MKQLLMAAVLTLTGNILHAAEHVVLITIDGVRWQEAFRGLDRELALDDEYSERQQELLDLFWHDDANQRASLVMPFIHHTVMHQGVVVGNRDLGSCARLTNDYNFSYPGYNEILSGVINDDINSNAKRPNPEKTFLELLSANEQFGGRMAAFGSWDVFPYIYNTERSGIPVNVGPLAAPLTDFEHTLNLLHRDISAHWPTVRHDAFTHHYALSWLRERRPRVVHIAYGEPDDFAHDGRYDEYVLATRRVDRFVEEVWSTLQDIDGYRDNTVMFVTVDHGRGETPRDSWMHHASERAVQQYMQSLAQRFPQGIEGSDAIWMAALGPGVPASGQITTEECLTADRIAATLMTLLGEDPAKYNAVMGRVMREFLP
ncbi:alkaline phosphatase family protein [Pseudohongiella spirulinae]|uniref:Phosphoglyceromutase n=1 Tax=Pseudohongiella spirulinae TaxID=1249552 RepID=A0A0S2KFS5_9GAMM|nr:alkaline phosphatase family protein [Pseudohongiella spirulinae]ALO47184.1 hypothetical protein PS2015_2550 [Pseudohongiella spirulinae]